MIQPNNWLGLLGGGQLGKMFSIKAQQLGYYVMVIDPNEDAPARSVANKWICADYSDQKALDHIAKSCSGVTTEFENVPAEVLGFFEEKLVVSPKQSAVRISQDRILEKEFLKKNGFKTSRFLSIKNDKEITNVDTEFDIYSSFMKNASVVISTDGFGGSIAFWGTRADDEAMEEALKSGSRAIEQMFEAYEWEAFNLPADKRGTVFHAYQAATHYTAHLRGGEKKDPTTRASVNWYGEGANIRNRALKKARKLITA